MPLELFDSLLTGQTPLHHEVNHSLLELVGQLDHDEPRTWIPSARRTTSKTGLSRRKQDWFVQNSVVVSEAKVDGPI